MVPIVTNELHFTRMFGPWLIPPLPYGCCYSQIDLYSILAKAPPAEPRNTTSHRPVGGIGCSVGPTISNKLGKKRHRREQGSSRRLASSVVVGGDERPASETALRATPREEVGGYLKRDPLGDEVAELNAKLQESLRR